MAWKVELSKAADRQLGRLGKRDQDRIARFIDDRLTGIDDPRILGHALTGPRFGSFWRFRVGDYRLICSLEDGRMVVVVVEIGHRSDVYR